MTPLPCLRLLFILFLVVPTSGGADTKEPSAAQRIVAVGDIHGALEPFRKILQEAELIDPFDAWIGGDTVLVQTGDFLDRGAAALEVAELLRHLQKEAEKEGGRVVVLMGNHEALNLTMDLRDVTADIVDELGRGRSERKQRNHCKLLFERLRRKPDAEPLSREEHGARCRDEIPLGWLEYVETLGPDGELGKWLRRLPVVAEIDGWLFLHGGLSEAYAQKTVEQLNDEVREDLARFDRLRRGLLYRDLITESSRLREIMGVARALHKVMVDRGTPIQRPPLEDLARAGDIRAWTIYDPEGPLWFRGYARWSDEEGLERMPGILEAAGVRGIVVGHTPQKSHAITNRFNAGAWLIDTGMLHEVYGGRPAALEIVGDRVTALYPGAREVLRGAPETVPTATNDDL